MIRLALLVLVAVFIAFAITSLHAALSPHPRHHSLNDTKETFMPSALKNMSYALLLALMFGVVTGWIGG